jgi:hypothetical protein
MSDGRPEIMTVYDLKDADGRVFAFEVDNITLGRDGLCRVVSTIPGATLRRRPVRFLSWFRESTFCEFELDGLLFSADEGLWGDDSRYWVGPEPPRWVPQLEAVRQAFLDHEPFIGPTRFTRLVIGGVFVAIVVWALWRLTLRHWRRLIHGSSCVETSRHAGEARLSCDSRASGAVSPGLG